MRPCGQLLLGFSMALLVTSAWGEPTVIEQRLWEGVEGFAAEPGEPAVEVRGSGDRIDRWTLGLNDPTLTVYRPHNSTGPHAACLVFPGGGYGGLSRDKEGHWVAKWMAERGLVGVAVDYRCGGAAHRHPVPLSDAQRAMRLVRHQAEDWGIDPERVGVMGFSAGGHLAASVATHSGAPLPGVDDPLASFSPRANFAVLVYPVISMREEVAHAGSRKNLLGPAPTEAMVHEHSADEQVDANTPPTLLIHSINDSVVPVANPQRYYDACLKHQVPVEMHLYETGGHGYGLWAEEGTIAGWPTVLEGWLSAQGFAIQTAE